MNSDQENSLDSPVHYPAGLTYKPVVQEILKKKEKEEEPAGDIVKSFRMKDGGCLTISTSKFGQIRYHLKLADSRQIVLEKSQNHMGLIVTDAEGKTVKTLGCEM